MPPSTDVVYLGQAAGSQQLQSHALGAAACIGSPTEFTETTFHSHGWRIVNLVMLWSRHIIQAAGRTSVTINLISAAGIRWRHHLGITSPRMNVRTLGDENDGTRSFEIRCNELSFRGLLRRIRAIPGTVVSDVAEDPMNDNAKATVIFKGCTFTIETPFSDFIISSPPSCAAFDEFIAELRKGPAKWGEKFY